MMVIPRLLKGCDALIGTNIMCKWISTAPLLLMTMVGNIVDLVKKWGRPLKGLPQTSKRVLGARLPIASISLESCDVGLTFQLKILKFMDFINQEPLVGKEVRADRTQWWSPHNARC
jgi:hypothetical protein